MNTNSAAYKAGEAAADDNYVGINPYAFISSIEAAEWKAGFDAADLKSVRWWGASAVQAGTNYQMYETAPTRAAVDAKLYGQASGPKYGSVNYSRIEEQKNDEHDPRNT